MLTLDFSWQAGCSVAHKSCCLMIFQSRIFHEKSQIDLQIAKCEVLI